MVDIQLIKAESAIIDVLEKINEAIDSEVVVNTDICPGSFFKSQILVTAIGRIAKALEIIIPENCYIFFDKKLQKQLSIKEAAQKLLKEAKYGN